MYTLGYPFRPWTDAKAIADGAVDPRVHPRDRRATYGIDKHDPLPPPRRARAWSTAGRALDGRGCATRDRRAVQLTCSFLFTVRRLLRLRRGLHARVRRPRAVPRHDRAPAALARRPRLRGQARRRDRQRRDRGDARARARRRRAAHVTMLQRSPTYIVVAARADPIADVAAPRAARSSRVPADALEERAARHGVLQLTAAGSRAGEEAARRRRAQAARGTTSTSTRTSRRATSRGTSACASCPTAICSTRSRRPRRRSSPITSRRSPRRASRCARARARGRRRRHRDRAQAAAARRHRARRSTAARRAREDDDLQGHDVSDVPNLAFAVRLHERVVDAEVRPDEPVRLPPAQPHGRARLRGVHAAPRSVGRPRSRCSISRRATCSARSTSFPQQGARAAVEALPELRARPDRAAPRPRSTTGDGVRVTTG